MGVLAFLLLIVVAYVIFKAIGGLFGFVVTLLVAALVGWLASRIMGGDGAGPVMNILLGLVGGVLGDIVLNAIALNSIANLGFIGNVISGVVGAAIIIFLGRAFGAKNFAK